MDIRPRAIRVDIDELVLHGFDPRVRYMIGDALQAELTSLLRADARVSRKSREVIDAGAGAFAPADGGAQAGRSIARAVHRGLR